MPTIRQPEGCACERAAENLAYAHEKREVRVGTHHLKISVDIFYLHAPDHRTPLEETLGACNELYLGEAASARPES